MRMKVAEDICYGLEPTMGWHARQNTDETWMCIDKETTGKLTLTEKRDLFQFIIDFDKTKRIFNREEVFKFLQESAIGGLRIRKG
jgi:hypothetical protein